MDSPIIRTPQSPPLASTLNFRRSQRTMHLPLALGAHERQVGAEPGLQISSTGKACHHLVGDVHEFSPLTLTSAISDTSPDNASSGGSTNRSLQIICIHGLGCNRRYFSEAIEEIGKLWEANSSSALSTLSVLNYDMRGHGDSGCDGLNDIYKSFNVESNVNDIEHILNSDGFQGWENVMVLGHSYGGNVALALACRNHPRVRACVCADGGFINLAATYYSYDLCRTNLEPPMELNYMTYDSFFQLIKKSLGAAWSDVALDAMMRNYKRITSNISPVSQLSSIFSPHSTSSTSSNSSTSCSDNSSSSGSSSGSSSSSSSSSSSHHSSDRICLAISVPRYMALLHDLYKSPPVPAQLAAIHTHCQVTLLAVKDKGEKPCHFSDNKARDVEAIMRMLPRGRARWISDVDHNFVVTHPAFFAKELFSTLSL